MGSIWLRDLPTVLGPLGPHVYHGWENRSRSTGGYDGLVGIVIHHTASNTSPESDMAYMWSNASDRPIGAIYLGRDGRIVIGAAGATNTQGKGGPLTTSRGTCPQDKGNQYLLAIEAANAGNGEPWPQVQTDRYVDLVAALCDGYGFEAGDIFGHYDYCAPSCPGRKIDPAGPSPFGTVNSAGTWNIEAFRAAVNGAPPPPPPEEDDMTTPAVVYLGNGRIDHFVTGSDGQVWHNWWDLATSNWSDWQCLGGYLISSPTACSVDLGGGVWRIDVSGMGGDGALWHNVWDGLNWQGWGQVDTWP